MNRIRYGLLIMAIFIALTLSALNVVPALADEIAPTPEPTSSEEVVAETETTTSGGEEATPPDVSEVDSESETESSTVAEVIEALPEDTTLVVVDENGEALPLASAEAAEIIEIADPQWCPVGIAPGGVGCSGVKTSFNGGSAATNLLAWLLANPPTKAGVIWIDGNYNSTTAGEGGAVVIDGLNFASVGASMDDFALTINGGWNGLAGSTVLNVNNPSEFNVPFSIINWNNAVTINNIVVTTATGGAGVTALDVRTTGNITLNNVDVYDNTTFDGGAYLNNTAGTGNVVVNDSTFNDNGGAAMGLSIQSKGTVTLKNITANGNSVTGVIIQNNTATTPKAVTVNGTNHFSYNGWNGLLIYTKGVVTLNNITAMGNGTTAAGFGGLYIDNCNYNTGTSFCDYGVSSAVTIKGTNNFSDNGSDGLRVFSGGVITISNITANNNGLSASRPVATSEGYDAFGKGVLLHNYGSLTQKNVTISGTNVFNGNASNGITVIASGLLTINNIIANENGCDILFDTDTDYCAGAYLEAYMGITQTGYGKFSDNVDDGLQALNYFKGNLTLNNLFADGNGDFGVYVEGFGSTPVNITINGSNVFTNNTGIGLYIDANGTITLNNLNASYNGGNGVDAYNAYLTKAVTLKGTNTFNGNTGTGLYVQSFGAITTNAITAVGNTLGNGAFLDNCVDLSTGTCTALTAQAITLNGNNYFDNNTLYTGLYVASRGVITVNNLTSTYNGYHGAELNNQWINSVGGITIKGYAYATNNAQSGLTILSHSPVTLANVTTNLNSSFGTHIHNSGFLGPNNVTITGTNTFKNNGATGLLISTYGSVLLNNITANDNLGEGAHIGNNIYGLAKPVTLNGDNTFNNNAGNGLYINSLGAIKINNVMANNNTGASSSGANLINNGIVENQPITITGFGIFNGNGFMGLSASSNGAITLANINANENGDIGTYIVTENNATLTSFANVTLTGVNTFNSNGSYGLRLLTDGNITVSNITANNNVDTGAWLDNDFFANSGASGIRTVTVNGVNMFNGNQYGLQVYSNGTVSLTRITANYNNSFVGSDGLFVVTDGAINLTCGSMYGNADYGYELVAGVGKIVTIKGVFTYSNLGGNFASPTPVVTRTCPLP